MGLDPAPGVLRGGTIAVTSGGDGPIASFGEIPAGEAKSNWGSEWKKAALQWHDRVGDHHHVRPSTWPTVRTSWTSIPTYTDKFGDPLLRFTLDWTDHERSQGAMASPEYSQIAGEAMGGGVRRHRFAELERV